MVSALSITGKEEDKDHCLEYWEPHDTKECLPNGSPLDESQNFV